MGSIQEIIELLVKYLKIQAETNWWANNISWLIPLIVSAVLSSLAIWLSFRNTIKQSAENHRPYLTIKAFETTDPKSEGYIILCGYNNEVNTPSEYHEAKLEFGCKILFENIGYGIAASIKLLQTKYDITLFESWNSGSDNANCLSLLDVGFNSEEEITISISDYHKIDLGVDTSEIEKSIPLALMYSDLYGNIFCSIVILSFNRLEKTMSYTFYPEKTAHFNYVLRKQKISSKELKNRYKKIMLKLKRKSNKT